MKHLLVTNDFPPKAGGIQSYLWELWRRLPPESFVVLTTPYDGSAAWDAQQPFEIVRTSERVLLPTPRLKRQINELAAATQAGIVLLDPVAPVGLLGPHLDLPYGLVVHGAEITVPGRILPSKLALGHALRGAKIVIAAGGYPAAESERAAGRSLPTVNVPPGVDVDRFAPINGSARAAARQRFGYPKDAFVVYGQSRLVPRKGFDVLIDAVAQARTRVPKIQLVIGGKGRDANRLVQRAKEKSLEVQFLGFVCDDDLALRYASCDLFAMLSRNRWAGLEQEGFGIVFLEAAAAGVAQLAGRSGGSHEAVVHGETGFVFDNPSDVEAVADTIVTLATDPGLLRQLGANARQRAEAEFDYRILSARLHHAISTAIES